jgi:hypothetical protein
MKHRISPKVSTGLPHWWNFWERHRHPHTFSQLKIGLRRITGWLISKTIWLPGPGLFHALTMLIKFAKQNRASAVGAPACRRLWTWSEPAHADGSRIV